MVAVQACLWTTPVKRQNGANISNPMHDVFTRASSVGSYVGSGTLRKKSKSAKSVGTLTDLKTSPNRNVHASSPAVTSTSKVGPVSTPQNWPERQPKCWSMRTGYGTGRLLHHQVKAVVLRSSIKSIRAYGGHRELARMATPNN